MGLFKDMRDLSKAGKQMQKEQYGTTNPFKIMKQGAAQASEMIGDLKAGQAKAERLATEGLVGQATIQALRDTGVQVNNMPQLEFDLQVELEGREPYLVTHRQVVGHAALGQMQPGATVPVRVDPDDQTSLMIG